MNRTFSPPQPLVRIPSPIPPDALPPPRSVAELDRIPHDARTARVSSSHSMNRRVQSLDFMTPCTRTPHPTSLLWSFRPVFDKRSTIRKTYRISRSTLHLLYLSVFPRRHKNFPLISPQHPRRLHRIWSTRPLIWASSLHWVRAMLILLHEWHICMVLHHFSRRSRV